MFRFENNPIICNSAKVIGNRMRLISFLCLLLITQILFAQAPKELRTIIEVAGTDSGAGLGWDVKGLGDLNKDGYADVAVNASGLPPAQRRTYIYYGGNPMSSTPALTYRGGGQIISGDFNGDGWLDLAVERPYSDSVFIYFGKALRDTIPDTVLVGEHKGDGFGYTMTRGDLNGDGYDDLIVGAVGYDNSDPNNHQRGKLYIYAGGPSHQLNCVKTFTGDTLYANFSHDLAVGDLNGDGKKDLIVLGWNTTIPNSKFWYYYIWVYIGGSSLAALHRNLNIDSRNVTGGFGDHILSFDADGDGIDDILGKGALIFKGGNEIDTVPSYHIPPPYNDTAGFGDLPNVGGGGDYNHDGFKDILMSGVGLFSRPGVYLILGRQGIPKQYVAYRIWTSCCNEQFRGSFADAGDVNGDGVDDIIIGESDAGFPKAKGLFGIYSGDTTIILSVHEPSGFRPSEFNLSQNYPNPFNPLTTIKYSILKKTFVRIRIFDSSGREVTSLVNQEQGAGDYSVVWRGQDRNGAIVASGAYYYQLESADGQQAKRLMLLK